MTDVSIIIVNWNTRDLLAGCLRSVYDTVRDLSFEVLVVDNASSDGSAQMVRERFPLVRLIENVENVGFAAANNLAMAQAQGRYILLLNSDASLPSGALDRLIAFADARPRAGVVGVQLVNADGSFQAAWNRFPTPLTMLLEPWGIVQWVTRNPYYPSCPPGQAAHVQQCDWVGGACLLARAEAVAQVGLLDERFFMYSEEMDWCRRMRFAGWEIWYTPDVRVVHLGGGSAARFSYAQLSRLYRSKAVYAEKHFGRVMGKAVSLSFRVSAVVKALRSGAQAVGGLSGARARATAFAQAALRPWP